MYFKRLEIIGFKSFFNKTTLNFEPGITAIVGPNGCGKSNIFDAIRWALGEQSVKSLRGSEMQDVIFNGTDSKEPLSMAEVTLTFDNATRFFNLDQQEVAITRRIFRSGESEYLLNKALVRLKDILELLMGTGIGAESYSLVAQGKIDLILSSRPEDRRLVFDEAAGITKYKSQKREAQRRLEETEQNLLRVNDIIVEVKRQIGSLERQANKARRYQEVFGELKTKEGVLAILEKNELEKEKNEIVLRLDKEKSKEQELLEIIIRQEASINSCTQDLKAFEDRILDIKNQILSLDNIISRNNERIGFNRERIGELESDKVYLEGQLQQTKTRLALDEEKLDSLKNEYEGINKNISEKSVLLSEKGAELNNIAIAVKAALENISSVKSSILDLVARIAANKNEITEYSSKQQIYLARKKRLELERAMLGEERATVEADLSSANQEVETLEKNFTDKAIEISDRDQDLGKENASLNSLNTDISALEKQNLKFLSQKEFLDKLKSEYEGIGESMNALIYLDKMPSERVTGLVFKIKEYLNLNDQDKQAFGAANLKLTGEAKPVDLDTHKITEKIEQVRIKIEGLKDIKLQKERHIEELSGMVIKLKESLRAQEMELVNKKAYRSGIIEQCVKIKEEQDIIALELSDLGQELLLLEGEVLRAQSHLLSLEDQQKQKDEFILNEQSNIVSNNSRKEEVVVIITQTKTEIESLNKRLSSDRDTLAILEDACRQDKEGVANLERQIIDNHSKSQALALEAQDLELKIKEASVDTQAQRQSLSQIQDKYRQLFGDHDGLLKKIELERIELDALKNGAHELEMQGKEIDYRYLSIKDRMLQAYKIDLDKLSQELPEAGDRDLISQEIQRLKEKLDSYGTVNLVAIEEYDELKKRYDFLTQQQNDLLSAKESLHDAILKINRTTKQLFMETFEKIKQEFRNYFRLLFNGGDAQVFLIDEQDPLESGIEIICRPPGKKLQNVLLLSGGEKSLAAIALIFAIFKIKPAPFCVLDEIDAALDEANVDRYSRLLQDFAKDSQFIAITHNKKTIANTDVMYGITMEESGISKIVSVKFAQKKDKDKEPDMAAV